MKSRSGKQSVHGLILIAMLIASGFFIWQAAREVHSHIGLRLSIDQSEQQQQKVLDQKAELEETKRNLTNPDYLGKMVRGKYLVTREGEQVFKFPAMDKNSQDSSGS